MLRRLLAILLVAAFTLVLVGCYGPVKTVGFSVHVDCQSRVGNGPPFDLGTRVLHVSLDAPKWTTTGVTIPLSNMTVKGMDPGAGNFQFEYASVTTTGMDSFTTSIGTPPATISETNAFVAGIVSPPTLPENLGSANVLVTAPAKSKATVDLASVTLVGVGNPPIPFGVTCTPLAGQRTRLANISVRANPST
ncbi:MAG TPA: hypothetical protein VIC35_02420 [Acidimicrobiia bacterium]|jgi:hypothetical protein